MCITGFQKKNNPIWVKIDSVSIRQTLEAKVEIVLRLIIKIFDAINLVRKESIQIKKFFFWKSADCSGAIHTDL